MKIFVINLERATKRRRSAESQLLRLGLRYEIFQGIDGEQDLKDHPLKISKLGFLIENGYLPSIGEIACYASHLALWRKCVELDEPIVILEDDFLADDKLPDALEFISPYAEDLGFVRLEPISHKNQNRINLNGPAILDNGIFYLHQIMKKIPARMTGYVIAPSVAQQYIDMSKTIKMPVDHLPKRNWHQGHPFYALQPPVISLSDNSLDSSIAGRKKQFVRHFVGPLRAINRYRWRHQAHIRHKSTK